MIFSIIAAMDLGRGIGYQGKIPWYLPSDLRRFKRLTMGHYLIMGRETYESIGKPLPGRISVVVSRKLKSLPTECCVMESVEEAMLFVKDKGVKEAFIIGGGDIFSQTILCVQRLYLTFVQAHFEVDVWFPEYDEKEWTDIFREEVPSNEKDPYKSVFKIMEKK